MIVRPYNKQVTNENVALVNRLNPHIKLKIISADGF